MKPVNVIVTGVGGQGVVLATRILCHAVRDSRSSEIFGMAQRGGAVVSHVRIGQDVHSPTIPLGRAHAILGLEPVEVLRSIRFANPSTRIVMNTNSVIPPSVASRTAEYPPLERILDECRHFTQFIYLVNALKLAEEAGSPLTQNVVLLGALAATKILPIDMNTLASSIRELVPRKYLTANLKAFSAGFRSLHLKEK